MANKFYYILDERNEPIGVVKFSEEQLVEAVAPKIGDVLIGQRKDALEKLLNKLSWSTVTPREWEEGDY